MNLLAFLAIIFCSTFTACLVILTTVDEGPFAELIQAVTERIKNPRPSPMERTMERMYKNEPLWTFETRPAEPAPPKEPE